MAPILSFTAEEIWAYLPDHERRANSVFLSSMPAPNEAFVDHRLAEKWDRLFKERGEVLKALEEARSRGIIGHSLDAAVTLSADGARPGVLLYEFVRSDRERAQDALIVSRAELGTRGNAPPPSAVCTYASELLGTVIVSKAQGGKCERCWKYDEAVGTNRDHPDVCSRCAAVLDSRDTA
jgi:isoleucyl-tRNA synthetase